MREKSDLQVSELPTLHGQLGIGLVFQPKCLFYRSATLKTRHRTNVSLEFLPCLAGALRSAFKPILNLWVRRCLPLVCGVAPPALFR